MGTIESCYHILVKNGISPEVAALESYQSGEILGLFQDGLKLGLYESFIKRTSPTCQFGVADGHDKVNEFGMKAGEEIYNSIINGDFVNRLKIEENSGYLKRNTFNQKNLKSEFSKTLLRLRS